MRKFLAIVATTTVLAAGGIAAVGLISGSALAQDDAVTDEAAPRGFATVEAALAELVDENVITQDQADAVAEKLRELKADHRGRIGHRGFGRGLGASVLEALDMTPQELAEALESGATIAELADQAGVDVDALIDDALAAAELRLQAAVDAGRIDASEVDERLAEMEQRLTDLVNGEIDFPVRHGAGPEAGTDA